MSIVRNTVVLRNAALGAIVVLALFECNGFVAVRFGIKGVFCKENLSNTLRTNRVHGPRPFTRPSTRSDTARSQPVHGSDTARSQPVHGSVYGRYTTAVTWPSDTGIRLHRS